MKIKQSAAKQLRVILTDDTDFKTRETTIAFGAVTCNYMKEGDSSWTEKSITALNWTEIGNGIYLISFTGGELDTIGNFIYNVNVANILEYPGWVIIEANQNDDLADLITSYSPITHAATAGNITVGTQVAGTYAKTAIEDEDYWQIQCEAGDDAAGLDVDLTFSIGEGRDQ